MDLRARLVELCEAFHAGWAQELNPTHFQKVLAFQCIPAAIMCSWR
jgi:hypothetical protein